MSHAPSGPVYVLAATWSDYMLHVERLRRRKTGPDRYRYLPSGFASMVRGCYRDQAVLTSQSCTRKDWDQLSATLNSLPERPPAEVDALGRVSGCEASLTLFDDVETVPVNA